MTILELYEKYGVLLDGCWVELELSVVMYHIRDPFTIEGYVVWTMSDGRRFMCANRVLVRGFLTPLLTLQRARGLAVQVGWLRRKL